jgi:hypothetical protein
MTDSFKQTPYKTLIQILTKNLKNTYRKAKNLIAPEKS